MPEFHKLGTGIKKWLSSDLQVKLIVILGITGMVLILISQFVGEKRLPPDKTENGMAMYTASGYASELETRLSGLISGIEGAGETHVMITLENEGETVYAQEEKRNVDRQQEAGAAEVAKTYQKENIEQKYIIVDGANGREALVKTRLEPRVQGVVVVCEGAGNARVEQSIIHVVTTALNISTTRVCVVKISK